MIKKLETPQLNLPNIPKPGIADAIVIYETLSHTILDWWDSRNKIQLAICIPGCSFIETVVAWHYGNIGCGKLSRGVQEEKDFIWKVIIFKINFNIFFELKWQRDNKKWVLFS